MWITYAHLRAALAVVDRVGGHEGHRKFRCSLRRRRTMATLMVSLTLDGPTR
jgi:hypothetical protein